MIGFSFALVLFAVFLIVLALLLYRVKKGKSNCVREYYVFQSVSLLVGLGADTLYIMASGHSGWDIVAALLHIESSEPVAVTIVSRILTVVIFAICAFTVIRINKQWSGPVSRREHQINASKDIENHMIDDFMAALSTAFREDYDLKPYRPIPNFAGIDNFEDVDTLPWHLEFARILSLMSNQASIDPEQDWHPQQHCYISTYASKHKIAVYCTLDLPSADAIDRFLDYIHQIQPSYFKTIIAVKEGTASDLSAPLQRKNIEYIFKCDALQKLVDFTDYYRNINALYAQPLMEHTDVHIADIYVDPDCCLETGNKAFPLSPYVEQWLEEPGNRQLALLGEFGQGKTMFAIHLTHQLINVQNERIPILIPLRNKSPRNSNPWEILSYFAAQYGIAPEALSILNANGKLLLIFDGFDEMDLIGNDDIRKQHFQSLWKLVLPKSKVLVTGRPNYFLDWSEMASALGFQPDSSSAPHCVGLHLRPFQEEQIMLALRSAKESVRNGIQHIMETKLSNSFLDLISRPSHLFLVSQIWESRQLEQKYQNLTSAVIINEFLQDCFERQAAKGVRGSYFYLSSIEREYFMVGIAARMYKMGAVSISNDSFQVAMQELLELFPENLGAENPVFMKLRNGKNVREFAQADDNSFYAIVNDVRTCGILVNDTVNAGLCFAHKSFYDVLAAKFFLGKNLKFHNDAVSISNALARASSYNPRLKNDVVVRKLLAELICAEINVHTGGCDDQTRCRRIFEQCRKALAFRSFWRTPQAMFRHWHYMSAHEIPFSLGLRHTQSRTQLLAMLLISLIACILFGVRGIQFGQYKADAVRYYSELSISETPAFITEEPFTNTWPFIPVILVCTWIIIIFYPINDRLTLSAQERSELVLLTWYYACKENQIPDTVIFQQFSKSYRKAFADYVQRESLTELQNQMEKSREGFDEAGRRRL